MLQEHTRQVIVMSPLLDQLIQQFEQLSDQEQMELVRVLAERLKNPDSAPVRTRKLSEFRGIASYPLLDEDPQAWVSRNRHSNDEH